MAEDRDYTAEELALRSQSADHCIWWLPLTVLDGVIYIRYDSRPQLLKLNPPPTPNRTPRRRQWIPRSLAAMAALYLD